jgi:hypothetical protein
MKLNQTNLIAVLALGGMMAFTAIAPAQEAKPEAPAAAKKVEAAKPTAEDVAKLEAEVGLSAEQKTKVSALLNELKAKRRAINEDASLSADVKKAKTKALNEEILGKDGKIKKLMTAEQFAKWQKAQDALRASRK